MGNMSYCRFENTLADMQDCLDTLDNGVDFEGMSKYEKSAFLEMADIAEALNAALVDEYNKVDGEGNE